MKLNLTTPNVESSGGFEEKFFSIADQGMIFEILRNKLYSNPILAICREISCNSLDAHREVNKFDLPIEIHLPNSLEPFLKFKDYGPGISPDRMENVFIRYTASTKRNDNVQIGAMGCGAKTPFSYTDSFNVITIHDNVKYNYTCFIDETKIGKIALLSKQITDEQNGTEIVIPVKPEDFRSFIDNVEVATRHWKVKPTITGNNFSYQEIKEIAKGNNWKIANSNDKYTRDCQVKLIIDCIEYPLNLEAIKNFFNSKIIKTIRGDLYLYFDTGELTLSANREQVYLDPLTIDLLVERFHTFTVEVKQKLTDKINEFDNLWDANIFYKIEIHRFLYDPAVLGTFKWREIALSNGYYNVDCINFRKGRYSYRTGGAEKVTRKKAYSLELCQDSVLVVNDIEIEPSYRHIKKLFDNDKQLKDVFLISYKKFEIKNLHFDMMKPVFLSSLTKSRVKKEKNAVKTLYFLYDRYNNIFKHVSYDSFKEDKNKKVFCLLSKGIINNISIKDKVVSPSVLSHISKDNSSVSFYGIDKNLDEDKIKKITKGYPSLEEFVEQTYFSNNINIEELKWANKNNHILGDRWSNLYTHIKCKDSIFLKRFNIHEKIKKLINENEHMLAVYEFIYGEIPQNRIDSFLINNPEFNLEEVQKQFDERYPLLINLNFSSYSHRIEIYEKNVAHYINLVDCCEGKI